MIQAFVLASSVPNAHPAALEKLAEYHPKPIREVCTVTGRYNLFMRVEADNAEDMIAFVFKTLLEMKDISKTRVFFPGSASAKVAGTAREKNVISKEEAQ